MKENSDDQARRGAVGRRAVALVGRKWRELKQPPRHGRYALGRVLEDGQHPAVWVNLRGLFPKRAA
jgi:hypothetical protein